MAIPVAYPSSNDPDAWKAHIAEFDQWYADLGEQMPFPPAQVQRTSLGGVQVFKAAPEQQIFPTEKVILDTHGGSLIYLGGEHVGRQAAGMSARTGADVISVDYRMTPDHPYPVGLYDCIAAYAATIEQYGADNVIVCGVSAGGNHAAALTLRPARRRRCIDHIRAKMAVSERRVCRVLGQHRSTQREVPRGADEAALTRTLSRCLGNMAVTGIATTRRL